MRFEKVSLQQYISANQDENAAESYACIKLPTRATTASAGYDFFSPIAFELKPGASILVPTGIRVLLDTDKALFLFPKSGLGFKYRFQLDNTVGIIDSDYAGSDNEGHIIARITNDSREGKSLRIQSGEAFIQGIILQFFKTEDDQTDMIRNGGFGSTSKQNF